MHYLSAGCTSTVTTLYAIDGPPGPGAVPAARALVTREIYMIMMMNRH